MNLALPRSDLDVLMATMDVDVMGTAFSTPHGHIGPGGQGSWRREYGSHPGYP
jgi:hypothetical protein